MGNTLTYFGTDPTMLGLATIGGLLSFAYLIWKVLSYAYRQRSFVSRSFRSYRRKRLLRDIDRYKAAVRRKSTGKSDIVVAREDLRYGLKGIGDAFSDAGRGSKSRFVQIYLASQTQSDWCCTDAGVVVF
jgi:hypothetical protein